MSEEYEDYRHDDCPWCDTLDSEKNSAYTRKDLEDLGFDIPDFWGISVIG